MCSTSLRQEVFSDVRKLVVKIGTGVVTSDDGRLDSACIGSICRQVHELRERKVQVIIVTSGAIGVGIDALGLKRRPSVLPDLQAAAAVGQNRLMLAYDDALKKHGHHAGQILLTREDLEDRRRFVNVGNTIRSLLRMGAVPVVNENDTVSVDEIKFGGNDILAAQVLHVLRADALIYLSTVDGLYDTGGNVLDVVEKITEETFMLDTGKKSALGIGGMQTKLQSIQQITKAGEPVVIACGKADNVILRIMAGERVGTLFCPARTRLRSHKRWLRYSAKPRGTITVDEGAVRALVEKNKSLLASGVCKVAGSFGQGDIVAVAGPVGEVVAKGLTHYSSEDLEVIKGAKTGEIKSLLGYKYYDEVIHRDNLVILK
ncbi:MAG: glutamate 5-kinase [Planctomycetes bacterium]|nr:glutamate 5-kinase [Planctomycetota bacterium]